MKKVVRGVLLGLLAVVIIAGAVVAWFLFGGKKPEIAKQPYVVDNEGMSYLAVVNEEGVTYAAVTDADGNVYAAEINEDGSIGEPKGVITDSIDKSKLPTNYTGEYVADTVDVNMFTGSANEISEVATSGSEPVATTPSVGGQTATTQPGGNTGSTSTTRPNNAATTTTTGAKTFRIERYLDMFKSGQYLMEFKTNDEQLSETPITFATKNGNVLIDASIQNYSCKMLYLATEDKTYLLIDNFKKYSELPESMMGDESLDMSAMMSALSDGGTDGLVATTVEVNGQKLYCETRTNDDGSKTKFLFDGNTLVRVDTVNTDGSTDSIYISKLTSDVPDSTFEIPKNYGYLNLKWPAKFLS